MFFAAKKSPYLRPNLPIWKPKSPYLSPRKYHMYAHTCINMDLKIVILRLQIIDLGAKFG